jgi:Flp pilus assembly protein TadD
MEKESEYYAKKYFEEKNFYECIKTCFKAVSVYPESVWIYDLLGYSYMNCGMHSQARGCFATASELSGNKENYNRLIELLNEKEIKFNSERKRSFK